MAASSDGSLGKNQAASPPQVKNVRIGDSFYICHCDEETHCCIHECLQPFDSDAFRTQLAESLSNHHLQYFAEMIIGYLTLPANYPLTLSDSRTDGPSQLQYMAFLHPLSVNHSLCPIVLSEKEPL